MSTTPRLRKRLPLFYSTPALQRAYRNTHLTGQQLADAAGMDRGALGHYLRGDLAFGAVIKAKLEPVADLLGIARAEAIQPVAADAVYNSLGQPSTLAAIEKEAAE